MKQNKTKEKQIEHIEPTNEINCICLKNRNERKKLSKVKSLKLKLNDDSKQNDLILTPTTINHKWTFL